MVQMKVKAIFSWDALYLFVSLLLMLYALNLSIYSQNRGRIIVYFDKINQNILQYTYFILSSFSSSPTQWKSLILNIVTKLGPLLS